MKYQHILWLSAAILVSACGHSSEAGTGNSADTSKTTKSEEKTEKKDGPVSSFKINGTEAVSVMERGSLPTATYDPDGKTLNLYVHGYAAPDSKPRQLHFVALNFPLKTGEFHPTTVTFSRVDAQKQEFLYGVPKNGSFSVTITKLNMIDSAAENIMLLAEISGEFHGDLACETCFTPDQKNSPMGGIQKITDGRFENVKVRALRNK